MMNQLKNLAGHSVRIVALFCAMYTFSACAQNNIAENVPDSNTVGQLNSIESVSASRMAGGDVVIRVALKQATTVLPEAFTIGTPPRIALTFAQTSNGMGKKTQEFSEGDLRSATVVQAGDRTRLVLNLNKMLTYDTPKLKATVWC